MEYQDEVAGTGAAAALAAESVDGTTTQEVATMESEGGSGTATDFIRTEAAPAEVPKTLKHHGILTSLVAITSKEKGSRGIEVSCHSESNGRDYKTTIWPPREWTENVFITGAELKALPGPEGLTEKGNPKQTPYQRFGRTISSTDGSAELQRIIKAGARADKVPSADYRDFDGLVENANAVFSGIPVVFTTGPDGEPDPQYGFRIKVRAVYPYDAKYEKIRAEDAAGN